ncbi:MAG: hypothetical protein EBS01_04490, partial [Verrucomicrobia bacterium]|nr:hypothetical protein [Verrucomicrobiota bacterium]
MSPRQWRKTVQNAAAAVAPAALLLLCSNAAAHVLDAGGAPELGIHGMHLAQASGTATPKATTAGSANRPFQAGIFESFSPNVSVRWDERFLYVESSGMPSHP